MENKTMKLGCHVSMSGKEMFAGSVKEALSYGANTFMIYTGAPQNTRRKAISELNIETGQTLMKENGMEEFIVHAPYIINPANAVNPDIFQLAADFLRLELDRSSAMGSRILVLHPGAHVGAGREAGIQKIAECINLVLNNPKSQRTSSQEENDVKKHGEAETEGCMIALETMAGKGSEIGSRFEDLAEIYDRVEKNHLLRVCMDTCHLHDAGYDLQNFDKLLDEFDRILGLSQIAAIHINDSKNPQGAGKDRHANIGEGYIGYDALHRIVHHPALSAVPKILETPWRPVPDNPKKTLPPYKEEISWLLQP